MLIVEKDVDLQMLQLAVFDLTTVATSRRRASVEAKFRQPNY